MRYSPSHFEFVNLLLHTQDNDNMDPLSTANRKIVRHRSILHLSDNTGRTPLHAAVHEKLSSIVPSLLKLGADVDAQDNDNMTPLLLTDDKDIVQRLLEGGARVDLRNKNGQTPLHLASQRHNATLVALYLKSGVGVDTLDNNHRTPLHSVLLSHMSFSDKRKRRKRYLLEEIIVLLLEHAANVHLRDDHGRTPLQIASKLGVEELFSQADQTSN